MPQGLGGYGNISARIPMPVGGGATGANPVGALMQQLMAWRAQGQQPRQAAPPPEFERGMADMLGLTREQGSPIMGRPAPDQMQMPDEMQRRRMMMQQPQMAQSGNPLESWIGAR